MQVDIRTIKSKRQRQQVMKLQADAAWFEMKAALIRAYLAVRYYNPEQPRVPAGNGRESGRWGDGNGIDLPGQPRLRRVRVAQTALREANRFLEDEIPELRINGRREELDPVQALSVCIWDGSAQYRCEMGAVCRSVISATVRSIGVGYRSYRSDRI